MRHVLFVCHGNICRSPYAERRFDALTEGTIEAMSAGFVGSDRQPPDAALQIAGELGVSLHGHVSRTVDRALLRRVDLVVVMEPGQLRELRWLHGAELAVVLGDLDPARPERRSIEDPIFQPQEVFRRVYERIDRCLSELIEALGSVEAADPPPGRSS